MNLEKIAYLMGKNAAEQTIGPIDLYASLSLLGSDKLIAANKYNRENELADYLLNPFVEGPLREAGNRLQRRYEASLQDNPALTIGSPLLGALAGGTLGYLSGEGASRLHKLLGYRTSDDEVNKAVSGVILGSIAGVAAPLVAGGEKKQEKVRALGNKYLSKISKVVPSKDKKKSKIGPYDLQQMARLKRQELKLLAHEYNRNENVAHYLANPFVSGPVDNSLQYIANRKSTANTRYPYALNALSVVNPVTGLLLGVIAGDSDMRKELENRYGREAEKVLKQYQD